MNLTTSEKKFKALPMPEFDKIKPKTCLKKSVLKSCKFQLFSLQTESRGQDKKDKFVETLKKEY